MSLYGGIKIVGEPDLENVRRLDLLPLPAIQNMMKVGMAIDKEWFHDLSGKLETEIKNLRANILSYIPEKDLAIVDGFEADNEEDREPFNPNSAVQLSDLLFGRLKIGQGKSLKRTKSGNAISTGKRQLEQLKREHPILPLVLQYKEYTKLKSTYTDALPEMAVLHKAGYCAQCSIEHGDEDDFRAVHETDEWVVHTTLLWTRTNTGRLSSKNPNLQNQPVRSELGRASRKGFVARPGCKIVSCDFSQLQLRFLGHLSKDERFMWIFQNDKDPHTETACAIFDTDKPDPLTQRAPAKNVNFAIAFGETPRGLYEQLVSDSYGKSGLVVPDWLTMDWCEQFMIKWFGLYPAVSTYMEQQYYRARRYGCVWDMFGRVRWIPEVQSVHKKIVAEGLRYAGNQPIQAPDSGVMRLAIAEIEDKVCKPYRRAGIWCWQLMTIHDEVLVEVQEDWAPFVKYEVEEIMKNVLIDKQSGESWCRVPIKAEGKIMERWAK